MNVTNTRGKKRKAVVDAVAATIILESYLDFRKNILLGSITRNGEVIIPRGTDILQEGDSVVVVTTSERLTKLDDILK